MQNCPSIGCIFFAKRDAAKERSCQTSAFASGNSGYSRPAALLPYPPQYGFRSVALRPTLSSGLPFSSLFGSINYRLSVQLHYFVPKGFRTK